MLYAGPVIISDIVRPAKVSVAVAEPQENDFSVLVTVVTYVCTAKLPSETVMVVVASGFVETRVPSDSVTVPDCSVYSSVPLVTAVLEFQ